VLFPGLTWYLAEPGAADLTVTGSEAVTILSRVSLAAPGGAVGADLVRSRLGISAPAVGLASLPGAVEVTFINLGADQASVSARLKTADVLWLRGQDASEGISLGPGVQRTLVTRTDNSRTGLWLEFGAGTTSALYAPPVDAPPGTYSLPLLGRRAEPPPVKNGTLAKGSSAHIFSVQNGRLRWVSTLHALERLGPSLELVTLSDADLWRLPIGLPID
jgi:hypothetical protein